MCLNNKFIKYILIFIISNLAYCNYSIGGATCSLTPIPTNIAFTPPSIIPYDFTNTTTTSTVSVTCSAPGNNVSVSYTVTFSAGNSGNQSSRYLNASGAHLTYNIYKTAYSGILGTPTVAFSNSYRLRRNNPVPPSSYPSPHTDTFTIYSQVPANVFSTAGNYSDTIIVTLTW